MFSAVSTAVGAWQKQVLCFRFLRGFLEGFVLTACEVSKLRELAICLTKTPFQTHVALAPLHVESDSCNLSGVEYFHAKNRLGKLLFVSL